MKAIVFDTGPLISLAMNNMLFLIKPLKQSFCGEFYITEAVKRECVERPMTGKKFKFEALQIMKLIEDGLLKVFSNPQLKEDSMQLLQLANSIFIAHKNYVRNVQYAEIEIVAAANLLNADAVVIDEFITRTLLENALSLKDRMEFKLHTKIEIDKNNLARFKKIIGNRKVIRSFELVTVAYELGLFKEYYLNLPEPKKTLLEGILWAIKLNGCSVSEQEILDVIKTENLS